MSTWWMDCKNIKKKFFSRWLFEIIHIIRFEIWDLRSRDLKNFLGYDINYLSIWPFMRHPWFPTRKASKLIFVCFQLAGEWHHPASWKQSHGHHPASFEAMQHIILRKLIKKKSQIINQFDSPIVCEIIIISIETIQICFFHEVMAFDLIFLQSTI